MAANLDAMTYDELAAYIKSLDDEHRQQQKYLRCLLRLKAKKKSEVNDQQQ